MYECSEVLCIYVYLSLRSFNGFQFTSYQSQTSNSQIFPVDRSCLQTPTLRHYEPQQSDDVLGDNLQPLHHQLHPGTQGAKFGSEGEMPKVQMWSPSNPGNPHKYTYNLDEQLQNVPVSPEDVDDNELVAFVSLWLEKQETLMMLLPRNKNKIFEIITLLIDQNKPKLEQPTIICQPN